MKGRWGYCSRCVGRVQGKRRVGAYKPRVPPMDDAKTTPSTTQQMMIMIFFCTWKDEREKEREREEEGERGRQTNEGRVGMWDMRRNRGEKRETGSGQSHR